MDAIRVGVEDGVTDYIQSNFISAWIDDWASNNLDEAIQTYLEGNLGRHLESQDTVQPPQGDLKLLKGALVALTRYIESLEGTTGF